MNEPNDVSKPPASLALTGVHIFSIALNLPGPACARRLADFGAMVTKVEPPALLGGDPMRQYAQPYYDELHRDIEMRTLNLKSADDRAALDALLESADVLLTSQREAALNRLGLGWEQLHSRFPKLCQIAIVGSAESDEAGHDLTYLAEAGLATPPHLPVTLMADLGGAERAVTATFAALRQRDATGHGQRIVVALEDAAHAFSGPFRHGLTRPGGLLSGGHPGYNFYRAQDGWVVLAALEPHFAARVQSASGVAFEQDALTVFFNRGNIEHWSAWAAQHDIPLATLPLQNTEG
ncbi:MAG: CoA transferase [Betaproteobacteria bacterium]|nr:CoA transferase [Betaproteobacteria bacterium]